LLLFFILLKWGLETLKKTQIKRASMNLIRSKYNNKKKTNATLNQHKNEFCKDINKPQKGELRTTGSSFSFDLSHKWGNFVDPNQPKPSSHSRPSF
jgi:hypothetical protein